MKKSIRLKYEPSSQPSPGLKRDKMTLLTEHQFLGPYMRCIYIGAVSGPYIRCCGPYIPATSRKTASERRGNNL